jgi:hypothetical protein
MNYGCKMMVFLLLILFNSCSANQIQNDISFNNVTSSNEEDNNIVSEIQGYWYPISYTGSVSQALTPKDIDKFMKMHIFISNDTIINFADTIFDLSYTIDTVNTNDFLRMNVGEFYNYKMLAPNIMDVFIKCKQRSSTSGEVFENTWSFAYDRKYLLAFQDGVTFLCEKRKSSIVFNGSGTTVKELPLTDKEHILNLSYEFFSDPDELIMYDQDGKELYRSGMKGTKQEEHVAIPINKVTKITVKINGEAATSRWKFAIDLQ